MDKLKFWFIGLFGLFGFLWYRRSKKVSGAAPELQTAPASLKDDKTYQWIKQQSQTNKVQTYAQKNKFDPTINWLMSVTGMLSPTDFFKMDDRAQAAYLVQMGIKNGLNESQAKMLVAQKAHETGKTAGKGLFNSNVAEKNNNLGGVQWNPNYLKREGTSKGTPVPKKEGANLWYVRFDSIERNVKDIIRIVNRSGALKTDNITDYVGRLGDAGYFKPNGTKARAVYAAGMKHWYKELFQ